MATDTKNKELVTVCIPVYKEWITEAEKTSLLACCIHLSQYLISIVTFKELNLAAYIDFFSSRHIKINVKYFDISFFKDVDSYNGLMVSPHFYYSFTSFEYLLIYQLDALVFSDALRFWCSKGYDYIGAPWTNVVWINKKEINRKLPFIARWKWSSKLIMGKDGLVGNGGLSLRKTATFFRLSKKYEFQFSNKGFNEDVFWSKYVALKERSFRVPPAREALGFSIETLSPKARIQLKKISPFGCHAWQKLSESDRKELFSNAGVEIINC